jgi:DNA-binding transcriptional ArsR family regulator
MAKGQAKKKRKVDPAARAAPSDGDDIYKVFRGESPGGAAADDRIIHQRTRLAIVSMLAVNDKLSFNELKEMLDATDGNLSVHARKLEDAGYVDCKKSFEGRVPKTEYRITARGQRALERYLDHMESLIQAVRES